MATPVYVRAQSRVSIPTIVGLVDGIPDSTVKRTAKVVQHPVEDGSVISDHVHHNPVQVRMQVFVSDVVTTPGSQPAGESKQQIAFNTIRELFEQNELLTVTTPFETLDNMVISSHTWDRRSGASLGLELAMSLTQVRIVSDRASVDLTTTETTVGTTTETRESTPTADGGRQLPVNNDPTQTFNIVFSSRTFNGFRTIVRPLGRNLILAWNDFGSFWALDVFDEAGTPLWLAHRVTAGQQSIPGLTPQSNTPILGGRLSVEGDGTEPGRHAWGNTHNLIWRQHG